MTHWQKTIVNLNDSIKKVVDIIDKSSLQIALVVDENMRLLGTVTDGDIRRGLLKGLSLDKNVSEIFNPSPFTVDQGTSIDNIYEIMKRNYIKQIPVLDMKGCVVGLEVLKEALKKKTRTNPVVLMAGGLGSRLRPLTYDCPKPLLKIGGKPILEIILEKFIHDGFENFFVSINYKGEMIEDYFGDGSKWGVSIQYLREEEKLGTAGGLSLFPKSVNEPLIVMNGDLLTKVDFNHLLNFYLDNNSDATMCVREYMMKIPYGVVLTDNAHLISLEEKPSHKFFVNAGIYVLGKTAFDLVPKDKYFDMTDLFNLLIEKDMKSSVFPIKEYWLDIGRMKDFETANFEYGQIFSD